MKTHGINRLAVLAFDGQALLVELGFIANDRDRQTLMNPDTLRATAQVMAIVMRDAMQAQGVRA